MPSKTLFISSTYKDLAQHRRAVWEVLKKFDVSVRGMEEFGARTEKPLETCLAEVDQSDVYVGIIAFRIGSIDSASGKSFTQLEYERAVERGKAVLIYLADEEAAVVPFIYIDDETAKRVLLSAFKATLRERHTVDVFSAPEDLAAKLDRDFNRYFAHSRPQPETNGEDEREFEESAKVLKEFLLTPARFNGNEVRLAVAFTGDLFPVSRSLCQRFNLEYGNTIGAPIRIAKPADKLITADFADLYATRRRVDALRKLYVNKEADIYTLLQFSTGDVTQERARFFGFTGHKMTPQMEEALGIYVPPEGIIILLFSKAA